MTTESSRLILGVLQEVGLLPVRLDKVASGMAVVLRWDCDEKLGPTVIA